MLEKYPLWHKKYVGPYKGKHKLEKRVDANIKLIEQLKYGCSKKTNSLPVAGLSLMLFAKNPNAAGGGISFNQACFGKISKKYKAAKVAQKQEEKKPGQLLDSHKLIK